MSVVQLGILVLDASGSMGLDAGDGSIKARQIEEMVCKPLSICIERAEDPLAVLNEAGLIARLQESTTADFTDLAIIRYDDRAEVYRGVNPKPVNEYTLSPFGTVISNGSSERYMLDGAPFDLLEGMEGQTDIAAALHMAGALATDWVALMESDGHEPFVSIVLMTDGHHYSKNHSVNDVTSMATRIKSNKQLQGRPQVLIATAAFGDKADEPLLKTIATPRQHALVDDGFTQPGDVIDQHCFYAKTRSSLTLREFFLKSLMASQL